MELKHMVLRLYTASLQSITGLFSKHFSKRIFIRRPISSQLSFEELTQPTIFRYIFLWTISKRVQRLSGEGQVSK